MIFVVLAKSRFTATRYLDFRDSVSVKTSGLGPIPVYQTSDGSYFAVYKQKILAFDYFTPEQLVLVHVINASKTIILLNL
jgi:hypothetical protein